MFQEQAAPAGPRLAAHLSVAIELDWALSAAHRLDAADQPALDQLFRRQPELAERIRSLWGPDERLSYPGYLELSVLAYQAGLLFSTDATALLDSLEAAAANAPSDLLLASEKPDDRSRILRRLQLLRSSAARRRRYAALMRDVWTEIGPLWESTGRQVVEAAVGSRRSLLANPRTSWAEFARNEACAQTELERLVTALGAEDELVVVPAFFARKGLLFDLPGMLVVGVTAQSPGAASRARTEPLARQLRAISDPTRLAFLDALARRELTVTELAELFGLAQPTVSNHVKVLRDAGVVAQGDGPSRRRLVLQQAMVKEMLGELERILDPEVVPPGS